MLRLLHRLLHFGLASWMVLFQIFTIAAIANPVRASEPVPDAARPEQVDGWVTYSDQDARLHYEQGNWEQVAGIPAAEGGNLTYTVDAGATLRLQFQGTDIEVLYATGPEGGDFEGVVTDTVGHSLQQKQANGNSQAYQYGQRLAFTGFVEGHYTLTLTNGDGALWIEAIRVKGRLVNPAVAEIPAPQPPLTEGWNTYSDHDPFLLYSAGVWSTAAVDAALGGTLTYTIEPDALLDLAFYGTGIRLYYSKGPEGGSFTTTLNEDIHQTTHGTDVAYSYGHVVTFTDLPEGEHRLQVQNGEGAIWIEAVQVAGSLVDSNGLTVSPQEPPDLQRLLLEPMCSPEPAAYRVWRVRNANPVDVPFTWELSGSEQQGAGIATPAVGVVMGDTFFTTQTEAGSNTVHLLVNGEQQDTRASNPIVCSSATATYTPTVAPDPTDSPVSTDQPEQEQVTFCHVHGRADDPAGYDLYLKRS